MNLFLNKELLIKFLKFGVVGFSGVIVDFGFTFVCKEWLKIPKYFANAIGFTIAATTNYILNRMWTFASTNPEVLREFGEFFVISLIGLSINTTVLYICIKRFGMNFYWAKLIAIGITTLWNFFANYLYTFAAH
ncbi:MAG TPA: GtrA family protein [Salinivirgaceae bacterium]|nr:GtrA family protein [Salinivirgaceae bacterium]